MYCESFGNLLNSEHSAVFSIITVHGDSARVARESLRVSPCSQGGDGLAARMVDIVILQNIICFCVFLQADSESEFAFQGT